MATTIVSAATKGNSVLGFICRGGPVLNIRQRFSVSIKLTSNISINKKLTLVNRNRKLFCTTQGQQASEAIQETSLKACQVSVKEAAAMLDIRVGRVVRAWHHEEADSLFVEEVDVGEAEPRVICSGLVSHVPIEHLDGLSVLVLANLKPRNMRGVKSSGMLLAASDASHSRIELLFPPESSVPGHRVWFGELDVRDSCGDGDGEGLPVETDLPLPATPNQMQKKKIWELVQPSLGVDGSGVAVLEGCHVMMTQAGPVRAPSLKNANIA